MREKLIELLNKLPIEIESDVEYVADVLLAEGVIVPPCKVGDDLYWINPETNEIELAKADIKAVCYFGNGVFKIIVKDEDTPEDLGTEWALLTREEAEKAIAERSKNDNT